MDISKTVKSTIFRLSIALSAALGLPLAGCDREDPVRVYQAPKDTASTDQGVASIGATPANKAPANDLADLRWTLPANWKQAADSEGSAAAAFRPDARIQVDPADASLLLSVSHLGDNPAARSVLQNVNRWERQQGLPESAEADLPKVVAHVQAADGPIDMVDLKGGDKRLLGAIMPHADRTWFFKLAGPADAVSTHADEFQAFIRSIHFEQTAAPAPVVQGPPAPTSAAPVATDKWQLPAGWVAQPTTPMLLAKIQAGDALVKISSFGAGNFGDLQANLNRWRAEVDLGPATGADVKDGAPMQINGQAWKLFDFSGPESAGPARKRVIVAQTQIGTDVYFFKISGPAAAVAQQKAAFDQFVASSRLGS